MKKVLIYQIGRLDKDFLNKVCFQIDDLFFSSSLSSMAIKEFFDKKDYDTKITLLFPVSLPFNGPLYNNDKFKESCSKEFYESLFNAYSNPDDYLSNPDSLFKLHPHVVESVRFLSLPSMGTYTTKNGKIHFNSYYSDIVLLILVDMLKNVLEEGDQIEKIIIDISSGHNNYVSAL
ncbi:MAG: CRISPR-associated protein, partial [Proteobacteria bacterium]|nr:CRISPR-associated protein [Pseudomonadota bacterium]